MNAIPDPDRRPVYVVFGATGGIGSALSARLASNDARLVLSARGEDRLLTLSERIGGDVLPADVTLFDHVRSVLARTRERYGRVDGVACCVGSILIKPAHLTSEAEFEATLRVNLHAAFNVVKASARAMMPTGGSILLFSSAVARTGIVNHEAIAAAKAGVEGLARSAAATYANRGIRVNCVAPGLVDTPLSAPLLSGEASRAQSVSMHPLGRIGSADDVAEAASWLLDSSRSGWITGQVFGIDGGLSTLRTR